MGRLAALFSAFLPFILSISTWAQAPVPLINLPLVPDVIAPGGPQFTLTVNGTGFVASSVVDWNGIALATQFVNRSQLTATVPAANIARPGSGQITVVNPPPGGGTSNAIPFEVTHPNLVFTFNQSQFIINDSAPSVVAADFNGDGNLDIASSGLTPPEVSVYLGDGHGGFRHRGDYASFGNDNDSLVVGDFNGDGKLDLALRGVAILLGNGDGSFQPPITYNAGSNALAIGDFNGDGILDLASTDGSNVVYIQLGNGDGTFQNPVPYATGPGPYGIAVGDFNGDGILDLAIGLQNENAVEILLGNGDGSFQSPVDYATAGETGGVYVADLNGDGVLDLAVFNQSVPDVSVLLGNGDGTFQPHVDYSAGNYAYRGGLADINGDGKLDLVVTPWFVDEQFYVLLGNGDGTFQPPLSYSAGAFPLGIAFGDFNKDGILDVAIANQGGSGFSVMLGAVVELQPDSLDFGTVRVGTNSSLTTQLTNIRKFALETTGFTILGGQGAFSQTNNCGNKVGADKTCTITVTFAPQTAGSFDAELLVKDKAPGSPQVVFLSGVGSSAAQVKKN